MSSVLRGEPALRPVPVFWEYGVLGSIKPGKAEHQSPPLAMRVGNWKFLVNADGSAARLHDLSTDLREQHNLAASHPALVTEFTAQCLAWWQDLARVYAQPD